MMNDDPLKLMSGPLPSNEIANAELVGNYAVRFDWSDGHSTGIYGFSTLRSSCPCPECSPDGPPPLLPGLIARHNYHTGWTDRS